MYTATYSPDDNKIRLYASGRLPADVYARVRASGFIWAPKQGLFVAPAWTPSREDLALELAGEIGDEDTTLAERAEERAGRFDEYSDKRAGDAEAARRAVASIADGIPLGQPILVGHHSERHARRDAEKIKNGMRRAVKMWETSKYWTDRAAGALRHAKYKERPDVRARRIKTLEAEQRKCQRNKAKAERAARIWSTLDTTDAIKKAGGEPTTFAERALYVAGRSNTCPYGVYSDLDCGKITPEEAKERTLKAAAASLAWAERWLAHLANRIAYERAMLGEAGGTVADRTGPEVGGGCRCWASPRHGGWSYIQKVNKVSVTVLDNWQNPNDRDGSRNFTRTIPFDKLGAIMTKAEVDAKRAAGLLRESPDKTGFYLSDAPPPERREPEAPKPDAAAFDAMRESLAAGVQIVSAPQLFPTPPELAARMVELAEIEPGARVLEPSAGTGNLVAALQDAGARVEAVELNLALADGLASRCKGVPVIPGDFLDKGAFELGAPFERIVMNPPFVNGADIKHIQHALTFLKPGGRLVALCANGPRQVEALQPIATSWEEMPAGTFAGTGVRAALLTIDC